MSGPDTPNLPARAVLPREMEEPISLREFEQRIFALQQQINDRIRAERELVETRSSALENALRSERELIEARASALDKALALASQETERRLQDLNHAHQNATENWRRTLPREVYDTASAEWGKWRDLVNVHVTKMAAMPEQLSGIDVRVKTIESLANKIAGALILLGVMGLAGVVAFAMSLMRLAGLIR